MASRITINFTVASVLLVLSCQATNEVTLSRSAKAAYTTTVTSPSSADKDVIVSTLGGTVTVPAGSYSPAADLVLKDSASADFLVAVGQASTRPVVGGPLSFTSMLAGTTTQVDPSHAVNITLNVASVDSLGSDGAAIIVVTTANGSTKSFYVEHASLSVKNDTITRQRYVDIGAVKSGSFSVALVSGLSSAELSASYAPLPSIEVAESPSSEKTISTSSENENTSGSNSAGATTGSIAAPTNGGVASDPIFHLCTTSNNGLTYISNRDANTWDSYQLRNSSNQLYSSAGIVPSIAVDVLGRIQISAGVQINSGSANVHHFKNEISSWKTPSAWSDIELLYNTEYSHHSVIATRSDGNPIIVHGATNYGAHMATWSTGSTSSFYENRIHFNDWTLPDLQFSAAVKSDNTLVFATERQRPMYFPENERSHISLFQISDTAPSASSLSTPVASEIPSVDYFRSVAGGSCTLGNTMPALHVDSDDVVHLIFVCINANSRTLFYANSSNGYPLVNLGIDVSGSWIRPNLATIPVAGGSDIVQIVYGIVDLGGGSQSIHFRKSATNLASATSVLVASLVNTNATPQLINVNDTAYVFYLNGAAVEMRSMSSSASSFSNAAVISSVSDTANAQMCHGLGVSGAGYNGNSLYQHRSNY